MTTPNPYEEDLARAQGIVDALTAAASLIEADNIARHGRGGPVRAIQDQQHVANYAAWQIAQAFSLPWGGPSYPATPAVPTGGE